MSQARKNEEISKRYQKKTPRQHILDKPGMYIGPIDMVSEEVYVSTASNQIEKKMIQYIPGLERIFEEILLNAFDQTVRENTNTNEIRVDIDQESNVISIFNNGNGIPVIYKEEVGCYIPEMLFGQLLTSSNYDDTEKRITGGTNGLGAKASNLFSSWFKLETVDADNKKYFEMEWKNAMSEKSEPIIKNYRNKPYTRITFRPDLAKFNIEGLTDDMISLMKKRVIDTAFHANRTLKVWYNGENITIKKPEEYIELYGISLSTCLIDTSNDRWLIAVAPSDDGFRQISFVNGINTSSGGSHVQHVVQIVSKEIADKLKSKKMDLTLADIKNRLYVFVKSFIENPVFDSQTKECLKMPKSKFGSEYIMDERFKKKLVNCSIIKDMMEYSKYKSGKSLNKANGKKVPRVFGIENLEEANWAGKSKSEQCKLIVTEGLSAKTFAMSGYSVIGRDRYGIFPLKGKLLNVRGIDEKKVLNNDELCKLIKILGLKFDEKYTDVKSLRYGGIISLVDSDSVTGDTPLLLRSIYDKQHFVVAIELLASNYYPYGTEKEQAECNYEVWTENGWTSIQKIIRHRVSKKIYRVITESGIIDVTEDHSLLTSSGEKIAPKDCKVGDTLMHSFPEELHGSRPTETVRYSIIPSESMILGLFLANGSCSTQQNANGILYHWKLGHYDLLFLKKVKIILESFYNKIFEIDVLTSQNTSEWYILYTQGYENEHKYITEKYGYLLYHDANNKFIHHLILNGSKNIRKYFLNGYLMGYYGSQAIKYPIISSTYSKVCAQSLYVLCHSIGYDVKLSISRNDIHLIQMTFYNFRPKWNHTGSILQIVELGVLDANTYVYDLETSNHHFQAGIGNMIVHNTDGMHIHGLLLNFFHQYWPELLAMNYVQMCLTPIVKVTKGVQVKEFYNLNEYQSWINQTNDVHRWGVKYYKGLGTSNAKEAKQALTNIEKKLIYFHRDASADQSIELGFNKKLSDERKTWLIHSYDASLNMDRSTNQVPISDFIHKELIHFSHYDNQRSIPNILDGFKPTQRKIMYSALKYLQSSEMKVAQFGAKVAEKTDYHHGEMSIMNTIVNMAQNYMGSNNINVLEPNGGFGTRLNNRDAASPRYIHTSLSPIAKCIFNTMDNVLLKQNISDNKPVEPEWFIPCVPMILINGSEGIGTGFSTQILKYNVDDICTYLEYKLDGKVYQKNLLPWYRGFKGNIQRIAENKYVTYGVYTLRSPSRSLHITELPIGTWTDTFKDMLEEKWQKSDGTITEVVNNSDDVRIDFTIKFSPSYFPVIQQMSKAKILNEFHLISKLSETNMYLFDRNHHIQKYGSVLEILDYYYIVRLEFYEKRKENVMRLLHAEMTELFNKVKFIKYIRDAKINILKISNQELIKELERQKFDLIPKDDPTYKYLIDLPIRQLTNEYASKLSKQHKEKKEEYEIYKSINIKDMWKEEMNKIRAENKRVNDILYPSTLI